MSHKSTASRQKDLGTWMPTTANRHRTRPGLLVRSINSCVVQSSLTQDVFLPKDSKA